MGKLNYLNMFQLRRLRLKTHPRKNPERDADAEKGGGVKKPTAVDVCPLPPKLFVNSPTPDGSVAFEVQ